MTELLTAAQMRAIEQAAIESGEVTGLELMERAGRGVVEAIFEEWPELAATSHRAVVLCGPGNNGGDGFVVARLLKEWGWEVEVFLYGDPAKLPPDARVNYERWGEIGEPGISPERDIWYHGPSIIVDAMFGTGLKRPIDEELFFRALLRSHKRSSITRVVAIDFPSGMCADSGRMLMGRCGRADLTVTFHAMKFGHVVGSGPSLCGRLRVGDIGISQKHSLAYALESSTSFAPAYINDMVYSSVVSKPGDQSGEPGVSDHKYTYGNALILSGGPGKGGAARLAARGALRIGAGLVTVGCPPDALPETAARLDAVMCRAVADADALGRILEDDRLNALCLGPGLGVGQETRDLVTSVLAERRATVLDADALTSFADDPQTLFDQLHAACVLTPHAGEFARLFPDIAAKLAAPAENGPAYSKVDATREAAARAGCVILYKGPDTVIADPTGRAAINSAHYDRAAPWLATAGSGDVLAGFITGLLARRFDPMQAAETAAWLHVECALEFGPGLIAEDLPETLPAVFRKLGI